MKSLFILLLLSFPFISNAQKDTIQSAATDSTYFIFTARTAVPTRGGTQQLTGDYDVRVTSQRVESFLPYFGRSYFATRTNDGGIKFTSYKFEFKQSINKKGTRDIRIRFRDITDVREMIFSISANGYATLQVIPNNRQPITFYGEIR